METKDFISILDKIHNLIEEKKFEQAKMYIEITKETIKNGEK